MGGEPWDLGLVLRQLPNDARAIRIETMTDGPCLDVWSMGGQDRRYTIDIMRTYTTYLTDAGNLRWRWIKS